MFIKRSLISTAIVLLLPILALTVVIGCKKGSESTSENKAETTGTETATSAPAPKSSGPDEAVATVNGKEIMKSELEQIVEMYSAGAEGQHQGGAPGMDEQAKNDLRVKILDQMIEEEILFQKSKDYVKDLDQKVADEYANILKQFGSEEAFVEEISKNKLTLDDVKEQLGKKITIQAYLNDTVMSKIDVSDATLKDFYEKNKAQYERTAQIQASHILCSVAKEATPEQKDEALAKIKKVQERLKKGEKFEDIAKEVSDCPSGKNGGDLGLFGKGQMVKPFEDTAFGLKVGQTSDIVETQFGYHIIKVVDKKDAGLRTFEEVKPSIENNLKRKEFQTKMTQLLDELKGQAKIEKF